MVGKNDDGSMMGVRKADFGGLRHVPRLDSLNGAGTSVAPARKTSVMLPEDAHVRLKAFAAMSRRTVSALLAEAVEEYLARNGR